MRNKSRRSKRIFSIDTAKRYMNSFKRLTAKGRYWSYGNTIMIMKDKNITSRKIVMNNPEDYLTYLVPVGETINCDVWAVMSNPNTPIEKLEKVTLEVACNKAIEILNK